MNNCHPYANLLVFGFSFFDVSLFSLYLVSQINVPYQEMFLRIRSFQFLVARRFSIVWHIPPFEVLCVHRSVELEIIPSASPPGFFFHEPQPPPSWRSFTHSQICMGFTHRKVQWVPSAVPWALERQGWRRGSVERTVRKIITSGEGASFIPSVLTFTVAWVPPTCVYFCASMGLDCSFWKSTVQNIKQWTPRAAD